MTATRSLPTSGVDGADYMQAVSDSVKAISNYVAGNAVNPTGTNAYTFDLDVEAGLTAHPDGMRLSIIIPNTNTNAVTFEITGPSLGTKAAVRQNGDAFIGGELVAGTSYTFVFHSDEDKWFLESPQSIDSSTIQTAKTVFLHVEEFSSGSGTWDFPHRCNYEIHCFGAGGSGGRLTLAGGGGGGGHCIKRGEAASGLTLTYAVGVGGTGVSVNGDGNDGTDTTVTATGISMSAAGGGAGSGTGSGSASGGTGGAASGGDQNYTGSTGATHTTGSTAGAGGAAAFYQDGIDANTNDTNGVSLRSRGTPVAGFIASSPPPFIVDGVKGAAAEGTNGDRFCGGAGGNSGTSNGGLAAGGGGSRLGTSGAGGDGLIVILYTPDLDA